jgi:carbon-monoxide dehydrogenase medium subunit
VPARAFFTGLYQTALQPDELVTALEVPVAGADTCCGFGELARRQGDYAMVGVAAHGSRRANGFAALTLAFFAVGTGPVTAARAAAALTAGPFSTDRVQAAQQALGADLAPPADLHGTAKTKLHLARVLLGRVVSAMVEERAA